MFAEVNAAEEAELRRLERGSTLLPRPSAYLDLRLDDAEPALPGSRSAAAAPKMAAPATIAPPLSSRHPHSQPPARPHPAAPDAVSQLPKPQSTFHESFSGFGLASRSLTDSAVRKLIEESGCRVLRLTAVESQALAAPGPWATIGVLARRTEEDGANGKGPYDKWVLSDLHPEAPRTLTACIFGEARKVAAGAEVGAVFALLDPKLLPPKARGRPPVCVLSKRAALVQLGVCAHLGFCNSLLPDGSACGALIHRCRTDKCPEHLARARAPPPTLRMEILNSSAPLPPPKRRREDIAAAAPMGLHRLPNNPRARPGADYGALGARGVTGGSAGAGGGMAAGSSSSLTSAAAAKLQARAAAMAAGVGGAAATIGTVTAGAPTTVEPPRRLDPKHEVRAEFVKRGQSAGARNVVQMLADTERERAKLLRAREPPPPATTVLPPPHSAAPPPPAAPAAPVEADVEADEDEDDGGLSIEFEDEPPSDHIREADEPPKVAASDHIREADEPPKVAAKRSDKRSWEGMLRRAPVESASSGAVVSSAAASRFFGEVAEHEELSIHIGLVASGNKLRAELSRL